MGQERSETKKTRFHELIETETRMVVARVWGWREGGDVGQSTNFQL